MGLSIPHRTKTLKPSLPGTPTRRTTPCAPTITTSSNTGSVVNASDDGNASSKNAGVGTIASATGAAAATQTATIVLRRTSAHAKQVSLPSLLGHIHDASSMRTGRYEERDRDEMDEDYDRPRGIGAASSDVPPPTAPVNVNLTGDEAYQRRLALSQGYRPPETFTSSTTATSSTTLIPSSSSYGLPEVEHDNGIPGLRAMSSLSPPPAPAPAMVPVAQTGEEAYLRRLALSQQGFQPPRAPSPLPFSDSPPVQTPMVPPPMVPPPPASAPASGPVISAEKIQHSKQAAAAIAARLAALAPKMGGPPPAAPSPPASSSAPPEELSGSASKKYVTCLSSR